jgi:hypothetical protein
LVVSLLKVRGGPLESPRAFGRDIVEAGELNLELFCLNKNGRVL